MQNIVSNVTIKSYEIMKLYSNDSNNSFYTKFNDTNIIGSIYIPKININYPILSKYSDELLKISICKFYGPSEVNQKGNLCIVGHNYNSNVFFSKLHELNIKDEITIYALNNSYIKYSIYNIYEIGRNDMSYLSQFTYR